MQYFATPARFICACFISCALGFGLCQQPASASDIITIAHQSVPDLASPDERWGLDGGIVTWVQRNGNNNEVMWRDLASGNQGLATSTPHRVYPPVIEESRIVFSVYTDMSPAQDLFLYDIQSDSLTNVTNTDWPEIRPDLDGNLLVYEDGRNNSNQLRSDIYAMDLTTGVSVPVVQTTGYEYHGETAEGKVMYTDGYGISVKDINTGQVVEIGGIISTWARFDGQTVVWYDDINGGNGDYSIYGRNVNTLEYLTNLPAIGIRRTMPDIDGRFMVWAEQTRRGDYDIYGMDIITGSIFPVSTTLADERSPVIDDGYIVWSAHEEGTDLLSIYATQIPEPMSLVSLCIMGCLCCFSRKHQTS